MSCDKSAKSAVPSSGIQGASQSMPADFTAMGTTPKDCVASTTKQLRFVGLNSSKTCQAIARLMLEPWEFSWGFSQQRGF